VTCRRVFRLVGLLLLFSFFLLACSLDPNKRKQKYFASGEHYYEIGKYQEAAIQFANALKIDHNYADAHYQLGKSFVKLQKWPRAYEEFTRTVDLQPDNYAVRIDLCNLLIATGNFAQAQEQTDLVVQKWPNRAETHFISANLLAAQSKYPSALAEMQKAIGIDPVNWDFYLNLALIQMKTNQPELAEANFKRAIEINPGATDVHSMLGTFYQFRDRFADADQQFHAAIAIDPQNPELRAALARLYLAEGNKTEAEDFLKRAKDDFPDNSAGYRMLGDYYFSVGDLEKASTEYGSLHKAHPKDLEVTKNYIQLLILTNRLDQARNLELEARKNDPNNVQLLLYSGQIQNHDGQYSDAKATLQKLVQNDPSNAAAHYQLSIAMEGLGDEDDAERELREAVRLRPDLAEAQRSLALVAMRKGDMATLDEAATQLINLKPTVPEGYALHAVSAINRKQFTLAEEDIRKAVEVGPRSHLGYVQMGNLKFVQGEFGEAAKAYQDALDRDATSSDALRGLMNALIAQKQVDKAISVAESQISKSPANAGSYDLLGTALFRNKHDLNGAEAALKKSAELDNKDIDPIIKLGQVQVEEGKVDEAIALYQRSMSAHPTEATFDILIGQLYQSKQDWSNAEVFYQKALVLRPENPQASANLAYVMEQSGQNPDVAISLAETARRALPRSPGVADTLGWAYYQKGSYQSAIGLFEEALRLEQVNKSPDDPHVHLHLGMAYARSGHTAQARQQFELMLKITRNPSDAAEAQKQLALLKYNF